MPIPTLYHLKVKTIKGQKNFEFTLPGNVQIEKFVAAELESPKTVSVKVEWRNR